MKNFKMLLLTMGLTLSFTGFCYAADNSLSEGYYIDDTGYIVADMATEEELAQIEQDLDNQKTEEEKENIVETAIRFASDNIGKTYSQARRASGNAFDCSSLVYYSYLDAGLDTSNNGANTAAEIARKLISMGKRKEMKDIEVGDLIFYSGNSSRYLGIGHVAMYIGNGKMIEASSSKGMVVESEMRGTGAVAVCSVF